jgi:hypothetical protein
MQPKDMELGGKKIQTMAMRQLAQPATAFLHCAIYANSLESTLMVQNAE